MNAKSSVDLILADEGSGQRIRNLTFQQGQQQSVEVPIVVSATQNLRVVLNWADPAIALLGGDDVTQPALVNDLDLRVVDPSGHSHGAYVLDRGNVTTNASAGVNTTDNVEMVEIANAAPGVYRIVATGTSVTDGPQDAVLVTNVRTARPCVDVVESPSGNDSADRAYGNLAAGQAVAAGLCAQGDVDFYKFVATKTGAMSVTITTGDTPVRATITGNGISRTQDIPANSAATLNADVNTVPNTILLRIEAAGALGVEPQYSFTPEFPELRKRKRRGVN